MKTQQIKILIGLFMIAAAVAVSACSSGRAATQNAQTTTVSVSPTTAPTPDWKQQKRISKDIISTETKNERTKVKTKK